MPAEIEIPDEYVEALLYVAASTELSVDAVVEIALKFYLHRRKQND